MIRSMTGFGEVERETPVGLISVQVRTLNHRHFHAHFRLPVGGERWEAELTQLIRRHISRGSVHYRLSFQPGPDVTRPVFVDHGRVRAYLAALEEIRARHGVRGEVDLGLIARFSDVFEASEDELASVPFEEVAEATRAALTRVVEMREREGRTLGSDLLAALDTIAGALDAIEERAPERLRRERDRLRAAVSELAGDAAVDEDRLAREVAFLAERWDINEEIVRLRSHVGEFRRLVEEEAGEPAGKRLGFWVQEMHREANTIGSKANDSEIARLTVEIKAAIERLREQVENVE
jgi:uncharacterized protein (TIGR00255 family)